MKKLLLAAVVLVFLPKANASCTGVTITPSTFTLQSGKSQTFTANGGSSCTSNPTWTCSLSGHSSCGTFSPTTASTTVTYTAGPTPSGSSETVTLTATYPNSSFGTASVNVTTVQINALPMPPGAGAGDIAAYESYVVGSNYVNGVNPFMYWNSVESSNAQGTGSGGYDFTSFDASLVGSTTSIFPSGPPTKKINIIVVGVSGGCAIGGGTTSCGNSKTPAYVLTGSNPVPTLTCSGYPGKHNVANTGFPEVYDSRYFTPYQSFISAVLQHYSSSCNDSTTKPCTSTDGPNGANGPALAPYIGYIRFGLSAGGESYPFCEKNDNGSGNYSDTDWETYISNMDTYQAGRGSALQLMTSINQNDAELGNNTLLVALPDTEAGDAYGASIGFGSQGLQQSDYAGTHPCTSDWCNEFGIYSAKPSPVPLELQTVLASDPIPNDPIVNGTPSQTGSLCQLIPFGTTNHSGIFEIYPYDLLYAFDSGYCSLGGATQAYCSPHKYQTSYQTTIQNASNGTAQTRHDCSPN